MYKYYIDYSADSKVIGIRNGGSQIWLSDKNINDPKFKKYIDYQNIIPDLKQDNLSFYESEIVFNLKKQAKITDFLIHGPYIPFGLVFSERFVQLIKLFNLSDSISFKEITVLKDGIKTSETFYIIQQNLINERNIINWKKTLFYKPLERMLDNNKICFAFRDYGHYEENMTGLNLTKIEFLTEVYTKYDMIDAFGRLLISDRMAKKIAEQNFTNIIIKNLDAIACEDVRQHE
jgi:hypothetical protein